MRRTKILAAALAVAALATGPALADRFDDGQSITYYKALNGKVVGFVPIAMGFDLTEGWLAGMQRQADALGYTIVVRDPNWNTEAGIQALGSLIAEKPDLLIVHNNDMHSYNRMVKKALDEGITVLQVNQKVTTNGDAFVGADWYEIGVQDAKAVVKACGEGSGKSGKVAFIQGVPTSPGSAIVLQGAEDVFAEHPEIKVVANQAADWDATKAHAITSTILKQHEDLCGIVGFWDGQDVGTAAAIREAGKTGEVFLVTSGGGQRAAACDNIANGNFSTYVSYDVEGQARDLNSAIKILLQNKPETPAGKPFALYTPLKVFDKSTMRPDSCWTVDELKQFGG